MKKMIALICTLTGLMMSSFVQAEVVRIDKNSVKVIAEAELRCTPFKRHPGNMIVHGDLPIVTNNGRSLRFGFHDYADAYDSEDLNDLCTRIDGFVYSQIGNFEIELKEINNGEIEFAGNSFKVCRTKVLDVYVEKNKVISWEVKFIPTKCP